MTIEFNKERLLYLLALYKMSEEDLLSLLNEGRKRLVNKEAVFNNFIELSLLKRIDKIFAKGLNFYCDFSPLKQNSCSSVFFRKTQFGTDLNMESIKVVHEFETLKQALDAYNKLSKLKIKSDVEHYRIQDNPIDVAKKVRTLIYPGIIKDARKFLVALIEKCADHNIFVFEYVETWNKKNKTNIDGFFLKPNMIVLKHHKHYKREIFTLAHEIGHYLLDEEEIEHVDMMTIDDKVSINDVEKWCNDFAYFFIMGDTGEELFNLQNVDSSNDYYMDLVSELSNKTHISRLALYTRLYIDKKISYSLYNNIRTDLAEQYKSRIEKEKEKQDGKKQFGKTPKPIISPLFLKTMQYAYFKGVINEVTFCKRLNIKPNSFERLLWQ